MSDEVLIITDLVLILKEKVLLTIPNSQWVWCLFSFLQLLSLICVNVSGFLKRGAAEVPSKAA